MWSTSERTVCLVLATLILLSGFFSGTPSSSLWRGVTLIFSGVGGFWCGRLMLSDPPLRSWFARFCLVLLTILLLLGFAGFFFKADVLYFTRHHKHEFNGLILLLSYGPLTLLFGSKGWRTLMGIFLLLLSAYAISMSFDPMVWFPPVLFVGAIIIGTKVTKWLLVPCLFAFLLVSLFQKYEMPEYFYEKDSISIWIRVENLYFSYHMARQRPFLGIGLVAPRLQYLEDYSIVYPYLTKQEFAAVLPEENRSSENQFLTFMADLGFPFLLLYSFLVFVLYARLLKAVRRQTDKREYDPIILWIPITGALLHFQFFDGLLHPQISWFFHLFLGMVPREIAKSEEERSEGERGELSVSSS